MQAIYRITNITNESFYIGSTVNTRIRFQTHRRELRNGAHHCRPLQRAWAKYGEECFKFEIVEQVSAQDQLLVVEDRWLADCHGSPNCYNVSRHPQSAFRGLKHGADAKERVSRAQKGKQHRLGHLNSPDHRQRISAAMTGKRKSPEHAEKIRQRMIGTSYAKGRVVTEEMRAARGNPVVEITTGRQFISVAEAAQFHGLERPNLIRALRADTPLKRGPKCGLHFRYLEKHALPLATA